MNKKTFMYTLFAALIVAMPRAELQAVKRTPKRARIAKKSTAPAASKSAQTSSNQTTDEYTEQAIPEDFPGLIRTTPRWMQPQQNGEFPNEKTHNTIEPTITEQNPSITQTWGKVLRFKWTSLNRQDAKNIGETFVVMAIGYGAYKLYAAYNATAPRFNGPAGVGPHTPQPPMPPAPRGPQPRFFDDSDSDDDHSFSHLAPQSGQPNNDPFSLSALRRDLARDNVFHTSTIDDAIEESNTSARHTLFGHNAAVDQQTQTLHDLLDQEEQYRSRGQVVPAWLTNAIREIFKDSTQDIESSLLHESSDSDEVGIPSPSQPMSVAVHSNYAESESAPTHPVEAIECSVCMEDTEPADQIRLQCGHIFCTTCMRGQIELGLKEQNTTKIKCLDQTCNRTLEAHEVKYILNDNTKLSKYYDITLKNFFVGQDDIKHCPTADCTYAFVHSAHDQRQQVQCPSCKAQYCSDCLHNHKHDITCEDAELQRNPTAAEKANIEWIKKNTKACPNCGHGIEKNGGCKHMTCKECRHEFCWECLANFNGTGHGPFNCPRERIRANINNPTGLINLRNDLQAGLSRINTRTFTSSADRQHQSALREYIQEINDALDTLNNIASAPSPSVASPSPAQPMTSRLALSSPALEAALQAARNAHITLHTINTATSPATLINTIINITHGHIIILQRESVSQPYNTQITTALTTLRNIVAQAQAKHRNLMSLHQA